MFKKIIFVASLAAALSASALAQVTNTNTNTAKPATTGRRQTAAAKKPAATGDAAEARAVREAFDSLVDGIRRADAEAVMKLYWNSPQLILFNNNGSVTKSWEQAHSNRQSLYGKVRDVKLDVRDVRVKSLGPGAALVTCLWEQSQTADGQPERATGRLTLVYQKVGADWKIVHAHTSPDHPSPSNLLPSETTNGADSATRPPAKP